MTRGQLNSSSLDNAVNSQLLRQASICVNTVDSSSKLSLSLHINDGLPRRAIKRLKQAMKASEVRSDTNSRCTAFTVKRDEDTNVRLDHNKFPCVTTFDENRTHIIHSNSTENSVWSYSLCWKLTHHRRFRTQGLAPAGHTTTCY